MYSLVLLALLVAAARACSRSRRGSACRIRSCSCSAGSASAWCPGSRRRAAARGRARGHPAAAALLGGVLHLAARPAREHRARSACSRSGSCSSPSPSSRSCHAVIDLSWPAAFALGAVVSPTDPIAATSIASRLGLPRRIVALVEGESLVNDGTALVAYKFAIGAMVDGTFCLLEFSLSFVWTIGGGAIGLGVGRVLRAVRRRLEQPARGDHDRALLRATSPTCPAELAGASGVLAVVTVGIYVGWYTPELTTVADAAPGRRGLGDPHLRPQRAAVHPRRPAAAGDPRRAQRALAGALIRKGAIVAGGRSSCASSGSSRRRTCRG